MFGRMMRNTALVAAALLVTTWAASAGVVQPPDPPSVSKWQVQPANPSTLDVIFIRNVFTGCDHGGRAASRLEIDAATGRIDFYLAEKSDVCDTYVTDDITDSHVGYLPAGAYEVRFIGCGIPYDPEFPDCHEAQIPRLNFVVADAGRPRQTIPSSSPTASLALAGIVFLVGLSLARAR